MQPVELAICPRCREAMVLPMVALSRTDNATSICPDCGTDEAMRLFGGHSLPPQAEWPVDRIYEWPLFT